jgi:GR25 family glycosyltransferase involved in LPS biosynthesis
MSKVLNFFDDAYYINLDSRVDRKERFEEQMKDVGVHVNRFSAINPNINNLPSGIVEILTSQEPMKEEYRNHLYRTTAAKVGCFLSHQTIVKDAKARGLNNILIFEDDCLFFPEWKSEITKVIEDLKILDWDVIYFGGELNYDATRITDNVHLATRGVWGAHAYAVNKKCFDPIINIDINRCWMIDLFLVHYAEQAKFLVTKQLLVGQESSWSNLRDGIYEGCEHMIASWKRYMK